MKIPYKSNKSSVHQERRCKKSNGGLTIKKRGSLCQHGGSSDKVSIFVIIGGRRMLFRNI